MLGAAGALFVAGTFAPVPSAGAAGAAFGAALGLALLPLETVPVVGPAPALASGLVEVPGLDWAEGMLEAGGVTTTTGGAAAGGGVLTMMGAGAVWAGAVWTGADWTGAGAGADVVEVGEFNTAGGAEAGGGDVTVVRPGTTVASAVGLAGRLRYTAATMMRASTATASRT